MSRRGASNPADLLVVTVLEAVLAGGEGFDAVEGLVQLAGPRQADVLGNRAVIDVEIFEIACINRCLLASLKVSIR